MACCVILNSASLINSRSLSVRIRPPKSTTSVRKTVQFSPFSVFRRLLEYPSEWLWTGWPARRSDASPLSIVLLGIRCAAGIARCCTMSRTRGCELIKAAKSLVCTTRAQTISSATTVAERTLTFSARALADELAQATDGHHPFAAASFDADLDLGRRGSP